jgi:hypothetical protein
VVDPSLLRQAADRGVTICFADLDGADGLWVPEERTVLVSRGLSEERVAEVIEHELAHVMIDDQHADLDAGKDVLAGKSAPASRRPAAAALAAASLLVLIGGVTYGVHRATGDTKLDRVAPKPDGPGLLPPDESADPRPSTTVIKSVGPDGKVTYRTVTLTETAPVPSRTTTPSTSPSAVPSATRPAPRQTGQTSPPRTTTSPVPPPSTPPTYPPVTTPPQPTETAPTPTSPPDESGVAGEGGLGDGGGQGDGGLGTGTSVVDATAVDASDATPPGSTAP